MNHKYLLGLLTASLLIWSLNACQQNQISNPHPILGSWEITSIHWMTTDTTYSIDQAQPGLFIIDPNRYATMWTPIDEPRTPFVNLSQPTDEEMKSGFRSVVFNSGTYELTDSTLITTAQIAKVPGFEGGLQYYSYQVDSNRLELTMYDETYPDGGKPRWYGKYKTKFIYRRAK